MDRFIQTILAEHRESWPESLDPVVMPFTLALHRAYTVLYGRACTEMARFGLSPAEFDVLATLRRAPRPHELTPSQLQRSLVITSGGLTKVLHQLTSRGLVERPRVEGDRRVKPVRLSATGQPLIEQAFQAVKQLTRDQVSAVLNPEESAAMTTLLVRLVPDESSCQIVRCEGQD
ncbi:MAG: MarR family transcriptional regulator [Magnetococcales bacterium]|nr:MarR family transcriptional regulator [Magnetococcales bacterium]